MSEAGLHRAPRAEFDEYAEGYDAGGDAPLKRWVGDEAMFMRSRLAWLARALEKAAVKGPLSVLDYGCGVGLALSVWREMRPGDAVAGADVSEGMLHEARLRWTTGALPELRVIRGDGPWPPDTFDLILLSCVLHHVEPPDRDGIMRSALTMLKPGGVICIFEHNPRNPLVMRAVRNAKIDRHAILLDAEESVDRLRRSGFAGVECAYMFFLPPVLGPIVKIERAFSRVPLGGQYAVTASKPAPDAERYRRYWSDLITSHASHPANQFRYEEIEREVRALNPAPTRIIDCGCGDGALLDTVLAAFPCTEALGMDIASNAPATHPHRSFAFRQQNLGEPVPVELHQRFDLVLCSEVIEHVEDDETVIRNLADLTRPGGTMILTTQSGPMYRTEQSLGHLRHYDPAELARRVERAGFDVLRAYSCGWPWLNLQKIAAHTFQRTVQTRIVHAREVGMGFRVLFSVLRALYRWSLRSAGPQIVIVAKRHGASS